MRIPISGALGMAVVLTACLSAAQDKPQPSPVIPILPPFLRPKPAVSSG
ncbi:MAG: hypothetical protein R3F14_01615 [Polyangiaceae bacterium]